MSKVYSHLVEGLAFWPGSTISALFLGITALLVYHYMKTTDDLPTVNRICSLEPSAFSRLRFAFNSEKILHNAYHRYKGKKAYRLARGDVDYVVLPSECVTELNGLPASAINSRLRHAYSMTGHLNGMSVVLKNNLHVKTLLNRITPALPALLGPASTRMEETLYDVFPHGSNGWTTIEPMDLVVRCVSRAITLAAVGQPLCDDPELVELLFAHTKLVFTVMFVMRLVPAALQPILVWVLPHKWRLRSSLKRLESYIVPLVQASKAAKSFGTAPKPSTLVDWMVIEARSDVEEDPFVLTQLLAALAHPQFLGEIREEIRQKHEEINGRWDFASLNSLPKLDSAFKETIRLTPGSLTTYSRVMLQDHVLANGTRLKKGQFVCISSYGRATDDEIYEDAGRYDALRAYHKSQRDHATRPFKGVYGQDFRWGAGRWACAGRYLVSLLAKFIVVKLLDEYEFQLVPGVGRPPNSVFHEFVFVHPEARIMTKRRASNLGIRCH